MPPIPKKLRDQIRNNLGGSVPVSEKVEYVKRQGQTRDHHCHWPGCQSVVPPAMWGCKKHWFKWIRDAIWESFRPGQEKNWTPSTDYLEAAHAAQEWIRLNHPCAACEGSGKSSAGNECFPCHGSGVQT